MNASFVKNRILKTLRGIYLFLLVCISTNGFAQTVQSNFSAPDTVCVNAPVTITNTSTNATTNYWNFCTGSLNNTPVCTNLGNIGNYFSQPVFMDYAEDNGNYYGFVVNFNPGGITRLDFGNSLLNTPTPVFLGNVGGKMNVQTGSEGIQLVKNNGNWFAFVVGGSTLQGGSSPKLLKISFGVSLTNTSPIVYDYGNIGGMSQSIKLNMQNINGHWYGFSVNADNSTVTRFDFTSNLTNTPTAINLGNTGKLLAYPTGINLVETNGNWHAFITNDSLGIANSPNSFLVRLDFGNSLLNTPTAVKLGNPNGVLSSPRDLYIFKQCDATIGFAVNYDNNNDIVRFNIDDNLQGITNAVSLGNIGNFSFPHSINRIFRVDADVYSFVTNVANNTITRLQFPGCTNASIPNSSQTNPPSITYNTPGTYNINLTVDEGLPTQSSYCKPIVVLPPSTNLDFSFVQDDCNPLLITLQNKSNPLNGFNYIWNFGDGTTASGLNNLTAYEYYNSFNDYTVTLTNTSGCSETIKKTIPVRRRMDSLIITKDTTICGGTSIALKTIPSVSTANTNCWKPAAGLSDSTIANPVATPKNTTTYTLNSQVIGNNLVQNGDFEQGNSFFTTNYHDSINGYHEGTYTINNSAAMWHPFIARCHDHTSGNGKMLIANGALAKNTIVWQQTINNILPNTNYIFSTWLQSLSIQNPAQIRFHMNGQASSEVFTAILDTCVWQQPLTTWNSGNNTSVTISLIDEDTISNGNDFALDDISFHSSIIKTDSVRITISSLSPSPTVDTTLCNGQSVTLTAAPANAYKWAASAFISNDTLQSQIVTPASNTQFTVNRSNPTGCSVTDTFNVAVSNNKPQLDFSFAEDICNPLSIQFKNETVGNFAYTWNFGNNTFSNNTNTSLVYANYGSYPVTLKNTTGCPDSITKNITVGITMDSVIITRDTTLCSGSTLQLSSLPALAYCWFPSMGLSDASVGNPTVTVPASATTYFVNAKVSENNLIINGDFSLNTMGFTSAYIYDANSGKKEGVYWVGTSPQLQPKPWHNLFGFCTDHTTGNGNFMMVNGASIPKTIVWNEQVTIKSNTNYAFSAWAESLSKGNPAQLQFTINKKTIGGIFTAEPNTCIWKNFYVVWNSGNNTTADISVINLNTASGGNDFGLDDISFAKLNILRDSVTITPESVPAVTILNKDSAICVNDSFQLVASGASTYQWNNKNYLSNNTIFNPIAKPLQAASFIVTGFSALGCSATATLNVGVNPLPTITITPNTGICLGGSITLSAQSANASYSWQNNPSLSATNTAVPIAKPTDTTEYIVTVTDINNKCINKDSVQVAVWPLPTVTTRSDTSICLQTSTVLTTASTHAISFSWSPAIGLSDSSAQSPTVAATSSGATQYVVTAFTNHACAAKDTVSITYLALPVVSISNTRPINLCVGKSVQLSAKANNVTYVWTPSKGLNQDNISNPIATPDNTTQYFVIVKGQNCTAIDSIFIDVKQKPMFAVAPPTASICKGDSVLITASGGNKYTWDIANAVKYPDSSTNVVHPKVNTTYQVIASDTLCAVFKTFSVSIFLNHSPTVNVYKTNDIDCILTASTLIATGASSYSWSPTESLSDYTAATTLASPNQTTIYKLKALSGLGCETDTSIQVNVTKGDIGNGYQIPNAFTPMLTVNTCFGVKEWEHVISFSMNIYNRFGQKLFTTNNLSGCWDGRFNGFMQPAGTYVVDIKASTLCAEIRRKGTLVLIR